MMVQDVLAAWRFVSVFDLLPFGFICAVDPRRTHTTSPSPSSLEHMASHKPREE